jgi:hypothetical protein
VVRKKKIKGIQSRYLDSINFLFTVILFLLRCIWCYPNGDAGDDLHYLSIFLTVIEKGSSEWKVKYKFSFKSQTSSEKMEPIFETTDPVSAMTSGVGWPKFISHEKFFDPAKGYFKNGKFAIVCEVC